MILIRPFVLTAVAALAAAAGAQDSPPPRAGVSRAELFIASLGPAGGEPALRTSDLAMREQVRLAFYGIDATRLQVERGQLSAEEGERIVDGFKQTLRNFVHDQSNDALVLASTGQASDIPNIARSLGGLMSVARQDALLGREEVAMEAQTKMVNVLRTYSQRFAATCDQQTFPVEIALGLARQNELLGTGIDVSHCAKRRLTATIEHTRVTYRFENCSIDGGGNWKVTLSGFLSGEGEADDVYVERDGGRGEGLSIVTTRVEGPTLHGRYDGVMDNWNLSLELHMTGRPEDPPPVAAIPNDAGPNARPNGWPQAPVPEVSLPKAVKVGTLRTRAIRVIGDGYLGTDWVEGPVRLEERPCR